VVRSLVPSTARGAKVFLTGRTLESLEEVAEEIAPSNKQSR
jgi:NADP-dependent 3-hydroxy acid dehydrogenase YdfG